MKHQILPFFLFFLSLPLWAQNTGENSRQSFLFNFGWKFHPGNVENAASLNYDDSNWRSLDLPHDFQMEQPWKQSAGGARGFKATTSGWYRKSFKVDANWKDKKVLLDFEGLMLGGQVWFNGKKIVDIDYGYLGYEADITKEINYEGENIVAVYATTKGNSRWYTGGGLFRDVHLVVKNPISIARHGVFITTPRLSEQSADVQIQVDMEGISNRSFDVEIHAKVFAPNGQQIAETTLAAPRKNKLKIVEVPLPVVKVENPQLWSCETPHLYTTEVTLTYEGKVIDRVTETFGIRSLEFSPEFGFKLNGKKVFLKGMANHHDLGAIGAAVYDWSIERLFKQMKAFGYNHIRTSHNPYSKSFMRLADQYGILVVDELFDKWSDASYWAGQKPFTQLWYKLFPEWIKRDRNHPSVIMWSLGNELQMREDLAGFPTGDWGVTTYKMLDILVKRYDPTRKTTVAMYPARANAVSRKDAGFTNNFAPPELSLVTDIASYNYQYKAYPKYLEQAPDLIVYQSEATSNDLTRPFFGMDRERMVGLAYWGAVAYWGESNGWPKKGWNFSFFNRALEPHPQAYLIKSAFSEEPLVYIGVVDSEQEDVDWNDVTVGHLPLSAHWNREEGSNQKLFTYTNAEEVELLLNGKSIGVQKNNLDDPDHRNMIYWQDIPYQQGKITAIARSNGKEVARHQLETTGKAIRLHMEIENPDWKADGMDVQYIKVYAVDDKGRVVPTAEGEVTFDVQGEARIIAVDNGDHFTDELFSGHTKKLHNGFAMAILRSNQVAGEVKVKATVKGLRGVERKVKTRPLKARNKWADTGFRVAKYKDDKACAISYTFDDGLVEHYTLVAPRMEELGFRGTFWINGSKINKVATAIADTTRMTWAQLKEMSDRGHEISNHGWAHKNFNRFPLEEIREDIYKNDSALFACTGKMPRTFCYPNNSKKAEPMKIAVENRVGTRTFQRSIGSKSTPEDLEKWVNNLIRTNDWGVGMTHGITYGYDAFRDPQRFWNHLVKVKAQEDKIWVGTFEEVAAYTKEQRMLTYEITEKKTGFTITPHLSLDKKIFTEPLTGVVTGSKKITVRQGGKKLKTRSQDGKILFDFDPFGREITVQR